MDTLFAKSLSPMYHFVNTFHWYLLLLFFASNLYSQSAMFCICDGLASTTTTGATVKSCIEEERNALLTFKKNLTDPSLTSSWAGRDCCQWKGISCNNRTGHVEKLNLRNPYALGEDPWRAESYYYHYRLVRKTISPSLLSLKYLNYLDLSNNNFEDIPEFFGQLKSLRYLNLSRSAFSGQIPASFGNFSNLNVLDLSRSGFRPSKNLNWSHLSSLKYLDLSDMDLSMELESLLHALNMLPSLLEIHLSSCEIGSLSVSLPGVNSTSLLSLDMSRTYISSFPSWIFSLIGLRKLDLGTCYISGSFPSEFANLKSLEYLDLANNFLQGELPNSLGTLKNLQHLDLSFNGLNGSIPQSLGQLSQLVHLHLSFNGLNGSIPQSLGQLSQLVHLDLSFNGLNGSIPQSLGQLSQLVHLDLLGNSWEGILTEVHFINLTRLQYLGLGTDQYVSTNFSVTSEWASTFQLNRIFFENCRVGPAFPKWLENQIQLTDVTLTQTGISDSIPEEWLSKISHQVTNLNLSYNQFHGNLPFHQLKFPNLSWLLLSHNQFEGALRLSSDNAPKLLNLDLSYNQLNGTIPPSICSIQNMYILSLRKNQFSGEFPQAWSLWSEVLVVDVAYNNLSGSIPSSMGIPSSLEILQMNNNKLGGKIPSSLKNCTHLKIIDLGGNRLTGKLPSWIGSKVDTIQMLQLRSNLFTGHIPQQLCNLQDLNVLDLSHNKLSGTIPKCLSNITSLIYGNKSYNLPSYRVETMITSKGRELEYYGSNVELLKDIDLSSNNLQGEVPQQICSLVALGTLNLSMNHLTGQIPSKIGNLRWLETLDLSSNHLSGQIPHSLGSLTSLNHLNLSYNNLNGRIPTGNQLQTLEDPAIYKGNPSLCGVPLNVCPGDDTPTTTPAEDNKDEKDQEMFWFYLSSIILGFILGFWGVCGTLVLKKSWRYAYFQFVDNIKDKAALAIALTLARWRRKWGRN